MEEDIGREHDENQNDDPADLLSTCSTFCLWDVMKFGIFIKFFLALSAVPSLLGFCPPVSPSVMSPSHQSRWHESPRRDAQVKEGKDYGWWGTRWGRNSPEVQLTLFSRIILLVFAVEKKKILLRFHSQTMLQGTGWQCLLCGFQLLLFFCKIHALILSTLQSFEDHRSSKPSANPC